MVTVTRTGSRALYETVIGAGLACVDEVLEAERVALCGERYAHLVDREASRAGHVASSLVLGGRRVAVNSGYRIGRNGVRAIRCSSARSSRWCWEYRPGATRARWNRCRKQSRAGTSKSAVSERFVYGTERNWGN